MRIALKNNLEAKQGGQRCGKVPDDMSTDASRVAKDEV